MSQNTPTVEQIADAAHALRAGELVAFPTETVYGLGADATNSEAVAKIFAAKGRPRFNPLIVHVADLETAMVFGHFGPIAAQLARSFWPGPLTLVVRRKPDCGISDLVTAGLDTLAIRVPSHPVAQALLKATGRPIAAPSANVSGRVSATTAQHVRADFRSKVPTVLDAGPTECGLESTIVDATTETAFLLRPGAISTDEIAAATGIHPSPPLASDSEKPSAPGQLTSHYAPHAAVRLNADHASAGEAFLAFGPNAPPHDGPTINLSEQGDLTEAAINLFAALREFDAKGCSIIAVMPIPEIGLGEAINDRLRRAAAPRHPEHNPVNGAV
jgi:L-threonylcarbamoyladenylate synthase